MSDQPNVSNEVLLQVAAQIMSEQFDFVVQHFHQHLLNAQDTFHEGVSERQREYQLAVQLAVPMIPYSEDEKDSAERRFNSLSDRFEKEGTMLLEDFEKETADLHDALNGVIAKIAEEGKIGERARADELFTVTNICRREVAATVALVKSESAATATEVTSMHALKQSLEVATNELTQTRAILNDVTKELEEARSNSRLTLESERQKNHDSVAEERAEMAAKIQEILKESEGERNRHLEEVTDMHRRHATALEKTRQQGEDVRAEVEILREECDDLRQRESAIQKHHSNEKAHMMKSITELEVELQAAKVQSHSLHGEYKSRELELERLSETRKLVEVSSFKKRLSETGGGSVTPSRAAADSSYNGLGNLARNATENHFGSPSSVAAPPAYYNASNIGASSPPPSRGASVLNSAREPQTARSPSGTTPLQLAATHHSPHRSGSTYTAGGGANVSYVASPPYRESSVSSARGQSQSQQLHGDNKSPSRSVSLRSPSETYMKLQNLSSSWRDKLASGSTY